MTMTIRTQNQSGHHVMLSLHVTGGFLSGADLEFADGLNCLIGGRGAGKTTALEFLPFPGGSSVTALSRFLGLPYRGYDEEIPLASEEIQ